MTGAITVGSFGWRQGLRYGGLGLPLAFAALPIYVLLPHHYAATLGVPLAALGAVLMATRLLDAFVDPWIGAWVDRWFAHSRARVMQALGLSVAALGAGFAALFSPPIAGTLPLLAWCAAMVIVTTFGYSVAGIVHQAWGARLGGDAAARARVVSWREGLSLAGVLLASTLPGLVGLTPTTLVLALALAAGLALLAFAPWPAALLPAGERSSPAPLPPRLAVRPAPRPVPDGLAPLREPRFRRLLLVFLLNGIASALPATLVLFFVRDRLQAQAWEPLFLGAYFACAALALPLWVRVVRRIGLAPAWLAAMVLAVCGFIGAAGLGAGDHYAFLLVCMVTGLALGADLCVPAALLAGLVRDAGHGHQLEGRYFGWWTLTSKLTLALAAGLSLPLLQGLGYTPGARDDSALQALTLAYCVLPCLLKLPSAWLLMRLDRPLAPRLAEPAR